MRILMIHGRAQGGKDLQKLRDLWIDTLQQGFKANNQELPNSISIDFPFYGNTLDDLVSKADLPTPRDLQAKGPGKDKLFEEFLQSTLAEMKRRKNIPDSDVDAEMENPNVQEKGPQNWDWVQAIARVIDRYFSDTSNFTIETFLKDVYLYVNVPGVTRQINQCIQEAITNEPTIVIGHSLGSVIGYNIIKGQSGRFDVRKYITVGSPLGISAISSKLGVVENSSSPGGWFNAYDEKDFVALNPLDEVYFPTDPPIINHNGVNNHTDNHHGIVGYLNDPFIAREVASILA